jgi:hypothetical protein
MNRVTLTVGKEDVMEGVAMTTSYTGAKMGDGDREAYDRIFTTDEDGTVLERFWTEACEACNDRLKPFMAEAWDGSGDYTATLDLPGAFDTLLTGSIRNDLRGFFVNYITGRWYGFTNKGEAAAYTATAESLLADALRKVYYKKKPVRTAPTKKE